jgi:imidazolonepropionase-like amidohydrolase
MGRVGTSFLRAPSVPLICGPELQKAVTAPGNRRAAARAGVRRVVCVLGCATALAGCAAKSSLPLEREADTAVATAFVGVSVLPMVRDTVLTNHTVIVRGDRVVAIGPSRVLAVPSGAVTIDGRGRYLMPGLADMHTHARYPEDMLLYVAYGVTTVFNQSQPVTDSVGELRGRIARGEVVGPRLLGSGIRIDGGRGRGAGGPGVVNSAEEARAEVRRQHEAGFRFIKAYTFLSSEAFDAASAEARVLGMTVVGHIPWAAGLDGVLKAGQRMISHAEEYLTAHPSGARGTEGRTILERITLDTTEISWSVRQSKLSGIYVCTTLSTAESILSMWGRREGLDAALAVAEVRFVRPEWRERWLTTAYVSATTPMLPRVEYQRRLVGALHRAGVPLLLGTDSPGNPGMIPGYSLLNDIDAMVRAGVPLFDALQAGTRNAGLFVAETQPVTPAFGTIEVGKAADLILLADDPRRSSRSLRQRIGVMAAGRWYTSARLDSLLEKQALRLQKGRD